MTRAQRLLVASSLLSCALPCSCFDTKLIPAPPSHDGGAPGSAGMAAAGEAPSEAGAENGGASLGGSAGASISGGPLGGSAGKPAGGEPTRVTWLELRGSEAPASEQPNADLGISGQFYAYGDGCADLYWDEASRCATGKLCDALGGENWGIAVGFDFHNTGEQGTPPNTKLTWDPRDVGALGVAYDIGGEAKAPGLQLWVLNMDPIWQGECSAMTCEIAGPPDGQRLRSLQGELLFSDMDKDNWGGGGMSYEYDPAAVHALQLKLPAIEVGPTSFSFCVDALGIVR
jgi:hypothetical protein